MDKRIYEPREFLLSELKGKCGVYQIRNKVDGKVYIGSSKYLRDRIRVHFKSLKEIKHKNRHLQQAFNKYGEENFIFEIIEFCKEANQYEIEQYWIDYFIGENCYNISPIATRPPGWTERRTEEQRKKLSESMKEKFKDPKYKEAHCKRLKGKLLGAKSPKAKSVICLETKIIYEAANEAARQTGISASKIITCCLNHSRSIKGLHWVYKVDYDKMSEEEKQRILSKSKEKQVVCLETMKYFKSIRSASDAAGVTYQGIVDCCKGRRIEVGGRHWVYEEDFRNMTQEEVMRKLEQRKVVGKSCVCLETRKVYNSIEETATDCKVSAACICECCLGKRQVSGGKHWMYKEDYEKLSFKDIESIVFTKRRGRQVVCLETMKKYKRIIDAVADVNISLTSIQKCCENKLIETEGTHWVYYEDFIRMTKEDIERKLKQHTRAFLKCCCIETGEVFESLAQASRILKIDAGLISRVCQGKQESTKGYHFEYIND